MENITAIIDAEVTKAQRRGKRKAREISQCDTLLAEHQIELEALQEKMRTIKGKRQRLESDKRQNTLVESLETKGAQAWKSLSKERKWEKANVLAVLCCDKKLPPELQEVRWSTDAPVVPNTTSLPEVLLQDRDVLLARLARKDFLAAYSLRWPRRTFHLPPQFHGDKTVVMATLKQYPEILEQDVLTEALLDDRDVFLAFVHSEKLAAQRFGLLSKFSDSIRGSATLMLQAAKQLDATVVLENFTERLAGNCSFARKLVDALSTSVRPSDSALGRFTETVRSNKQIVLSLVQKNGRCLQDADSSLQRDLEIVRAACENNASALVFAATTTQRQLGKDLDFVMDIFTRWPEGTPGDSQLYGHLSKTLKLDRSVIVAAHKDRNLSFEDLPPELSQDQDFWLDVIKRDSSFWRALPADFENDPSFIRCIDSFCDDELVAEVFDRFPFLANERDIWLAVISSHDRLDMRHVIDNHAPQQIRRDKELMKMACEKESTVFGMLSEELQTDRAIVQALVCCAGSSSLQRIPHSTQCLYPDLVIQALGNCNDDYDYEELYESEGTVVADALWGNIEVIRAWFKIHCPVHRRFPDAIKSDADFGLVIASALTVDDGELADWEYCDWRISQFRNNTSVELRNNKEFMMQAVALNGLLFFATSATLRRDVDLAIVAYGGDQHLTRFQFFDDRDDIEGHNDDVEFLTRVRSTARSKVNDHKGFVEGFLRGMSPHAGNDCNLSMLVQGPETTLAFKKSIAQFVGFPRGKSLEKHRNAVSNLSRVPEPYRYEEEGCDCPYCGMY